MPEDLPHLPSAPDRGAEPAISDEDRPLQTDCHSVAKPSALTLYVPLLLGLVSTLACWHAVGKGLHLGFGFPLLFSIPLVFSFMCLRLPSLVQTALALLGAHYGYQWSWGFSALVVVLWYLVYLFVLWRVDPSPSKAKGTV